MSEPHVTGLALALELTEMGRRMQAQRYRREHPNASDAEVDDVVAAWMFDRPGAPEGDGPPGHLVALPRKRL